MRSEAKRELCNAQRESNHSNRVKVEVSDRRTMMRWKAPHMGRGKRGAGVARMGSRPLVMCMLVLAAVLLTTGARGDTVAVEGNDEMERRDGDCEGFFTCVECLACEGCGWCPDSGACVQATEDMLGPLAPATCSGDFLGTQCPTIVSSVSELTVSEEGTSASFFYVLNRQPGAVLQCVLTVSDADEGNINSTFVLFTPSTWNVPYYVGVTGVDDNVDDDGAQFAIELSSCSSSDATFTGIQPASVTVFNLDDDMAGLTSSDLNVELEEGGPTALLRITATSEPASQVVILVAPQDATELTVNSPVGGFGVITPVNYISGIPVILEAVDDTVLDGNITSLVIVSVQTIGTSSEFLDVDSVSITALTIDDDVAGLIVTLISGSVVEESDASATLVYSVVLESAPLSAVTVPVAVNDTSELTADITSLTFDGTNWNMAQLVTLAGLDDCSIDGDVPVSVTFGPTVTSALGYGGLMVVETLESIDNDVAGFSVTTEQPVIVLTEGDAGVVVLVTLTACPGAGQTVDFTLMISDPSRATLNVTSGFLSSADWNVGIYVRIIATQNEIDDGDTMLTLDVVSVEPTGDFMGAMEAADFLVVDDDMASMLVSLADSTSGLTEPYTVSENGTSVELLVHLGSEPIDTVTVTFSTDATELSVNVTSLTFDASTWGTPQAIAAIGVDDFIVDGLVAVELVLEAASVGDSIYDSLSSMVSFTNEDNDVAGVIAIGANGTASVLESEVELEINVTLTSQPVAPVIVTMGLGNGTTEALLRDGSGSDTEPFVLVFAPGDWNVPQTVFLRPIDDLFVDGDIYVLVASALSSTDADFEGIMSESVFIVVDDDVAGLTASLNETSVFEATSSAAALSVSLDARPYGTVTLTVLASSDLTVSDSMITLTSAIFQSNGDVILFAVDDDFVTGDRSATVTVTVTEVADARDEVFVNVTMSLTLTVVDNDMVGVILDAAANLQVAEDGDAATIFVSLTSRPVSTVIVPLIVSDRSQLQLVPPRVSIEPDGWRTPESVVVIAVNNFLVEANTSVVVSLDPIEAPGDSRYDGAVFGASVIVEVLDDDTPGILAGLASRPTRESGEVANMTVRLLSEPANDVELPVSVSAPSVAMLVTDGDCQPSPLTFTVANWEVDQVVCVAGIDNLVDDAASLLAGILFDVQFGPSVSADAIYSGLSATTQVLSLDDDNAGVEVDTSDVALLYESGSVASVPFTVRLLTEPRGDVVIPVSVIESVRVLAMPSSLTFTASTWSMPQTVALSAGFDPIASGLSTYTVVVGPAVSTDVQYEATTLVFSPLIQDDVFSADVNVTVADTGERASVAAVPPVSEALTAVVVVLRLTSQPTARVTFNLTTSDPSAVMVTPATVDVLPDQWMNEFFIALVGVDDAVVDGVQWAEIAFEVASVDPGYDDLPLQGFFVACQDDDSAGSTLSISDPSSPVTEASSVASHIWIFVESLDVDTTYEVFVEDLNSMVGAEVSIFHENGTLIPLGTGNESVFSFSLDGVSSPQVLILQSLDDFEDDGDVQVDLLLSVNAVPTGLASPLTEPTIVQTRNVSLSVLDNDVAGVSVVASEATTIVPCENASSPCAAFSLNVATNEAATAATLQVALTSQPTGDVQVPISLSAGAPATISSSRLTFSAEAWNVTQDVVVRGSTDRTVRGGSFTVTFGTLSSSEDAIYDDLASGVVVSVVREETVAPVISSVAPAVASTIEDVELVISGQAFDATAVVFVDVLDADRISGVTRRRLEDRPGEQMNRRVFIDSNVTLDEEIFPPGVWLQLPTFFISSNFLSVDYDSIRVLDDGAYDVLVVNGDNSHVENVNAFYLTSLCADLGAVGPFGNCVACEPSVASCPGGNRLVVNSGFFAPVAAATDGSGVLAASCRPEIRCEGGILGSDGMVSDAGCREGYSGELCGECASDYFRVTWRICASCQLSELATAVYIVFLVIVLIWVVHFGAKGLAYAMTYAIFAQIATSSNGIFVENVPVILLRVLHVLQALTFDPSAIQLVRYIAVVYTVVCFSVEARRSFSPHYVPCLFLYSFVMFILCRVVLLVPTRS